MIKEIARRKEYIRRTHHSSPIIVYTYFIHIIIRLLRYCTWLLISLICIKVSTHMHAAAAI